MSLVTSAVTAAERRHPRNFVEHLSALSRDRAADLALVAMSREGEVRLDYAELDRRVRAVAALLQQRFEPGARALLPLDNNEHYVVAFLACLHAGLIAVPVFPPESVREQHLARLASIAADCSAAVVLTTSDVVDLLRDHADLFGSAATIAVDGIDAAMAAQWVPHEPSGADIAFLQYTSGSTSMPKGVMVSHANLMANERAIEERLGVRADDVFVNWLPLYHDMGLIGGLLQPLHRGIPVVLMSPSFFLERPVRWLEAIARHGGTISGGPDFAYRLCVERVKDGRLAELDLSSWRVAFSGAEPVRSDTLHAFVERFASSRFDAGAVYPCYGLAEATLLVSGGRRGSGFLPRAFDAASLAAARPLHAKRNSSGSAVEVATLVGCGIAPTEHSIRIADPATGSPTAPGCVGEIWFSGPSVAQGYWQRAEESARTFVERDGARWLRTGDLGFVDEGELFITGRIKDLIIVRGHNLYPQDIERCIESEVEGVRSGRVAAFAVDTESGEGIGIAAEVSRSARRQGSTQLLIEALTTAVGRQSGERVSVIVLLNPGGLPKTSSGKLQRGACRQGWRAGALDAYAIWETGRFVLGESGDGVSPTGETDPTTALERELGSIWRAALGACAEQQSLKDLHFFSSGGSSLTATKVAAEVAQRWKVSFPVRLVFEHPRLVDCAAALQSRLDAGSSETPIPRLPADQRGRPLPLSHAQERQWFLWNLDPESAAYHVSFGLRLRGALQMTSMQRALDAAVGRHEALRTVFGRGSNGIAFQQVSPASSFEVPVIDLRTVPEAERERAAVDEARRLLSAPMDLTRGPLRRASLLRLGEREHVLVLVFHHIISDGASIQHLIGEIARDYAAHLQDAIAPATAPAIQYSDYALWQRGWLAGGEGARQLAWWRDHLGDDQPALRLPGEQVASATARALRLSIELPLALTEQLRSLVRAEGATLFMALLAGFQALLHRYTDQTDIRIGVPVANRERAQTQGVMGMFVNTLVVRGDVEGRRSFLDLLGQARKTMLGAQAHQDLPFELLVAALQPARHAGQSPLVQVVLNHRTEDSDALSALPDLVASEFALPEPAAQFALALDAIERTGGRVELRFNYPEARFESGTIERLASHYVGLLEALSVRPKQCIGEVPLFAGEARGGQVPDATTSLPVHRAFEQRAKERADAPAVIFGDSQLSYAELNASANRLAHRLRAQGIGPDDRVGILLERSPAMLVAVFAVLKSGAAYVPLDPDYPRPRLAFMAQDSGIKVLICATRQDAQLPAVDIPVLRVDAAAVDAEPDSNPNEAVHGESLAYVIYTSGSTGLPKGVGVSHGALSRHLEAAQSYLRLSSSDRMLQFSTISFDGFVEQLFAPLAVGAAIVLRGPALWTLEEFQREVIERRISIADLPAAYWNLLAQDWARQGSVDRGELRQVQVSGEAMPAQGLRAWRAVRIDGVRLLNLYGPTESVVTATVQDCAEIAPESDHAPIGRALAGRHLHVVDADLNLAPLGAVGELCIGGPLLARGYLARPSLSAERFVADPFDTRGGRMYRTGDLVRWNAAGALEFIGRADRQIKLRGLRVELGEIETQLLADPEIGEAVVIARDDAAGLRLIGYVAPRAGLTVDAIELRQRLAAALPDHLVPALLVVLERLPVGVHGKVDRSALPDPLPASERVTEPPQGDIESALAGIWTELLHVQRVGRHDSFFELGGHSLLLLQAHRMIEDRLGKKPAVVDLFKYPTLATLAAFLAAAGPAEPQRIAEVEARGRRQLGAFLPRRTSKTTT